MPFFYPKACFWNRLQYLHKHTPPFIENLALAKPYEINSLFCCKLFFSMVFCGSEAYDLHSLPLSALFMFNNSSTIATGNLSHAI
jgi:hypothetical protein